MTSTKTSDPTGARPAATAVDVLILGTGPSGSTLAKRCASAGLQVAIVENRQPGGTCALRGCNPKKVLALSAALMDWNSAAAGKLVESASTKFDWSQLTSFVRTFTGEVPQSTREDFESRGIVLAEGDPVFDGATAVTVGETKFSAKHVVLAVGAEPVVPDVPGKELCVSSDDFFTLEELPPRIVFVGAGYISLEFAHLTARAGRETTVVDSGSQILSEFDPDLCEALVAQSEKAGIAFRFNQTLASIEASGPDGALVARFRSGSGDPDLSVECDLVVLAAGRTPALDGLPEKYFQRSDGGDGIAVDSRTLACIGHDAVFAVGDCASTTRPPLTMSANIEAEIVLNQILQRAGLEPKEPRFQAEPHLIPAVAFTSPPIAMVGYSEAEARERYPRLALKLDDHSSNGSVRKRGFDCGHSKVLVDRDSDTVVGAHVIGPGAEELVNLFALAMQQGVTVSALRQSVFAFPTFGAELAGLLPDPE